MNLDLLLKIVSTLSTLAIGIAASFLAYQQFRLSRSKLKFDLYEKRLKLFQTVRDFASTLAIKGEADKGKFYHDTIERYFLFEADVCAYIEEMYEKAKLIEHIKLELTRPNLTEEEAQQLKDRLVKDQTWFFDQPEHAIKVFGKDLSIKTLRE